MDAFIDSKTGYLSELVVGMRPDGTDAIGTEGEPFGLPPVSLPEFLTAVHCYSLSLMALVCSS